MPQAGRAIALRRYAVALFSTLAHLLMIIMLMMLPETRGRAIANLDAEAASAATSPSRIAVGRG